MMDLRVLSIIISTAITISVAASVTEINRVSSLMSAAYQLKARMEMQKLEGLAFQARTLAKLQNIRADLELREETERLERERAQALAPRGIQGGPGEAGRVGEPGERGPPGIPGSFGMDGQDGRILSEDSLFQDINRVRAVAQLNRNRLDQLIFQNATTLGKCSGMILVDGQETVGFDRYLLTNTCSWVVWSVHGVEMRLKITGPRDAQYSLAVSGSSVSVPIGSWIAIPSNYALIHYHYSSHTEYTEQTPSTLVVEETTSVNSNKILPTNSFVYSEPFALTYPLPPATKYGDSERTFIIGRAVCDEKSTSISIYDISMELCCDWVETSWFDTTVTPPQLRTERFPHGSETLTIPPFTPFLSLFYTDSSNVGSGFKIRAECIEIAAKDSRLNSS